MDPRSINYSKDTTNSSRLFSHYSKLQWYCFHIISNPPLPIVLKKPKEQKEVATGQSPSTYSFADVDDEFFLYSKYSEYNQAANIGTIPRKNDTCIHNITSSHHIIKSQQWTHPITEDWNTQKPNENTQSKKAGLHTRTQFSSTPHNFINHS